MSGWKRHKVLELEKAELTRAGVCVALNIRQTMWVSHVPYNFQILNFVAISFMIHRDIQMKIDQFRNPAQRYTMKTFRKSLTLTLSNPIS